MYPPDLSPPLPPYKWMLLCSSSTLMNHFFQLLQPSPSIIGHHLQYNHFPCREKGQLLRHCSGPKSATSQYCYSKSWLHSVNPLDTQLTRNRWQLQLAPPLRRVDLWVISDDLRGLLCVSVDNSSSAAVESRWKKDRKNRENPQLCRCLSRAN